MERFTENPVDEKGRYGAVSIGNITEDGLGAPYRTIQTFG